MKLIALLLGSALVLPTSFPAAQPETEPVAWGQLTNNAGCVIFSEGHKTSGRFYGIAVGTKTIGTLTPIEMQHYTLESKPIPETQENMDNLMRLAQKDHVLFVKIPEKHSAELLEKARGRCKSVE